MSIYLNLVDIVLGRKAEKKNSKNEHVQELTAKQKNPKAFTFQSVVKGVRKFRR